MKKRRKLNGETPREVIETCVKNALGQEKPKPRLDIIDLCQDICLEDFGRSYANLVEEIYDRLAPESLRELRRPASALAS